VEHDSAPENCRNISADTEQTTAVCLFSEVFEIDKQIPLEGSTEQNSIAKQHNFRPIDYLGKWKVVTARGSDEKQTHTHNLLTVLPPNV
jgi:hypothetical protein